MCPECLVTTGLLLKQCSSNLFVTWNPSSLFQNFVEPLFQSSMATIKVYFVSGKCQKIRSVSNDENNLHLITAYLTFDDVSSFFSFQVLFSTLIAINQIYVLVIGRGVYF